MNKKLWMISLLLIAGDLLGDPWGKDADLARPCRQRKERCPPPARCGTPILGSAAEVLIRYHNEVISPCDGPRSHFTPSSSYYTLEAMRRYGFVQGWLLGCDRLMRENDDEWLYHKVLSDGGCLIKYNPVP